jgi:hypothetical protein
MEAEIVDRDSVDYWKREYRRTGRAGLFGTTLLGLCAFSSMLIADFKTKDRNTELYNENKILIEASKPITNEWTELKIKGLDTVKVNHIDTLSWIVPDSLIRVRQHIPKF